MNFVNTLLGRRRPIFEANSSNSLRRKAAERMAINMPIQGSAAEMIKIAMLNINNELKYGRAPITLFDDAQRTVFRHMETTFFPRFLKSRLYRKLYQKLKIQVQLYTNEKKMLYYFMNIVLLS